MPSTATPHTPAPGTRPRPPWLRALGAHDPPAAIEVDGQSFHRQRVFKHDAFAATALYAAADDPGRRVLGKFARRQPAFGVPLGWLGRWFCAREQRVFDRLADHPLVPSTLSPPRVDGRPWPAASARAFVEGKPLEPGDRPPDAFFSELEKLIEAFHARRVAVVDLHKRENILVGDDGRPHLMDFQISLAAPTHALRALDPRTWLYRSFARADRYHLMKQWIRHRPDQLTPQQQNLDRYRPIGVRAWRVFIAPVHIARRKLFLALKIRSGSGDAATELPPEAPPESCLLYTSPSPRDQRGSRMPSSA